MTHFDQDATIKERDGTVVAEVRGNVWRESADTTVGGQRYNWRAVTGFETGVVGTGNLLLDIGGREYRIVDASHHRVLNYLELGLTEVRAGG